ncbi:20619_t:CDS:1, partial [Racocetra persica]
DEKLDWFLNGLQESFRARIEFQCPKEYNKAKEWAAQIEHYNRKKKNYKSKDTCVIYNVDFSVQNEIDEMTAAFENMKINRLGCESTRREEVEMIVKEVLKATERNQGKRSNQRGNLKTIKCFNCQQDGHTARNCPNRVLVENKRESEGESVKIAGADVRLVELSEGNRSCDLRYLQINMFDID